MKIDIDRRKKDFCSERTPTVKGLVSIIIPTFDRPHLLSRAIESIVAQTYTEYEIIVVQNGPQNNSEEIVRHFKSLGAPIEYYYCSWANAANARNFGVTVSRGEFIAILEDDDVWFPTKLEKQVAVFNHHPRLGLVSCRAVVKNLYGDELGLRPAEHNDCDFLNLVSMECIRVIGALSGVVVRREVFEKTGFFQTDYQISNDVAFYIECARFYECHTMDEVLYAYTQHAQNLSADYLSGFLEVCHILRNMKIAPEKGVTRELVRAAIQRYALAFYREASACMTEKNYLKAFKNYGVAVYLSPSIGEVIPWGNEGFLPYRWLRPYAASLRAMVMLLASSLSWIPERLNVHLER